MVIFLMLFDMQGVDTCLGFFKKLRICSESLWGTTAESKALWGPALLFLLSGLSVLLSLSAFLSPGFWRQVHAVICRPDLRGNREIGFAKGQVACIRPWPHPLSLGPTGPVSSHPYIPEQRVSKAGSLPPWLEECGNSHYNWALSIVLRGKMSLWGTKQAVQITRDYILSGIAQFPLWKLKDNLYCLIPQNAFPLNPNNKWLCSHGNSYFGRKKIRENWIFRTGL